MSDYIEYIERGKRVPIVVMKDSRGLIIIPIPPMTEKEYAFFRKQMEVYKAAIIRPDAANPRADADGDAGEGRGK